MTEVVFIDKTAMEIAAEYFPDATEDFLEGIAWGETGYPYWWRIGIDGDTPLDCFRMQQARAAARENFGFLTSYHDGEWFYKQFLKEQRAKWSVAAASCHLD